MHIIERLTKNKVIQPPQWLPTNVHYLVITGSESYGVSSGNSDIDVKGISIPPKNMLFPHLDGKIPGFNWPSEKEYNKKTNWQSHHNHDVSTGKEYDLDIKSITRFFFLAYGCNPDIIDSLFVPPRCILFESKAGQLMRDERHLFLSKLGWNKYKGYAYGQVRRYLYGDDYKPEGKRIKIVEQYGYDTKGAYHVVRLLNEIEQILTTGDLNLEINREQLKSIRNGEWTKEQILEYFHNKEKQLEKIYLESDLQAKPDKEKIEELLRECLKIQYNELEIVIDKNKDRKTLEMVYSLLQERMY
jgi:predicted nucleotidyltransferase